MKGMKYLIYKTLDLTPEEINDSIQHCYEFEGVEISIYRDGPMIVAEPKNIAKRDIERNSDDYRIEYLLSNLPPTLFQ